MGGAKNCPETPRQKMIGMMYLVLTAMLALNVSTDILNGFRLVDDSLHFTIDAIESRNQEMMQAFQIAAEQNEAKNGEWYQKAIQLQQKSDSIYDFIQNFKYEIGVLADGKKKAPSKEVVGVRTIAARDNLDVTAQYAINEGHATELKDMFVAYREFLIALTEGEKEVEFNKMFSTSGGTTNDGDPIDWEHVIFDGMPVGASITILTKMQNDIRAAQSEMIQYLRDQTDAADLRVNKMEVFVVPNSRYVIRGGKYSAKIVLAAVDSTARPDYYIEGQKINETGIYEVIASGLGQKKYHGELVLPAKNEGEEDIRFPFESDYSVGEPSVTVSNTELNVMYRDYQNKFSISVPGVANDKVRVNVGNATASQRGGLWLIKPNGSAKEVTISVSAELDGRMQLMGSLSYRVKDLPKPGAYFKSGSTEYNEGKIARNALLNPQATVIASYGSEGLLDLQYSITSFQLQTSMGYSQSAGNKFSKAQLDQLSKLKPGAVVNIVDIRAKGVDGKEVRLRGIPLTLN